MSAFNPWESPASARSPRAQLSRALTMTVVARALGAFAKTSLAERPTPLNFVAGAALYLHGQQLFGAESSGAVLIGVSAIAMLIGVLNLRRWALAGYVLGLCFDASASSVAVRLAVLTFALVYTRRFRW